MDVAFDNRATNEGQRVEMAFLFLSLVQLAGPQRVQREPQLAIALRQCKLAANRREKRRCETYFPRGAIMRRSLNRRA